MWTVHLLGHKHPRTGVGSVGPAIKAARLGESEDPEVMGAPIDAVRHEFMATYPAADASDPKDAKRKAFARALKEARERELIGSREIGGIDYLWLVEPDSDTSTPQASGGLKLDVDKPVIRPDGQDTP